MSNPNEWNESPSPDSLGSGASSDGTQNEGDEDTASGGAPEPAEMTDPNGTPVENPSG